METIILAAGCFWGVEETFRQTIGVTNTQVGYIGGHTNNPSYEDVCSHTTGHAEAVKVEFDNTQISLAQILDIFWNAHDPTQVGGQGPDIGDQYRSEIFYFTPEQKTIAEESKATTQKRFSKPITTKITKFTNFYKAEEYHQQYFLKRQQHLLGNL
ncbi:MAG: peptide-methionine (S)-S-oxide reductase MsrA [Patescibacteria group bacterium]|uniref:Peptide methionine sulfoxide reductase MsrA n=1 Tax=candidate division WWE3 bacterium TaxID=2053526 RepID=A0A955EB86_UNCKA|nr:peptide-methionine (S)-S-oxide reductase MsrA [candidate division WWE3 bacterium]